MSLIAGVMSLDGSDVRLLIPDSIAAIYDGISRGDDRREVYERNGVYIVHVDIGAYGDHASAAEPSVCFLNGKAYYRSKKSSSTMGRDREVQIAAEAVVAGCLDEYLLNCRGVFSLCAYSERENRLALATDRFGARPIYYCSDGKFFFFASSIRILELIPRIDKRIAISKALEKPIFGYSLLDHTPYEGIKSLVGGAVLNVSPKGLSIHKYFNWSGVKPTSDPKNTWVSEAYRRFQDAVHIRSMDTERPISFLSGGLDSRCIVSVLHESKKQVKTLTFETRGRVDSQIAQAFAKNIGVSNSVFPNDELKPFLVALAEAVKNQVKDLEIGDGLGRVFSGDGGSVGVGFVYVDDDLVNKARSKNVELLSLAISGNRIPKRLFRRDLVDLINEGIAESVRSELMTIDSDDPYRRVHVFFMNTDQRSHLHEFFENIDLFRFEYELPFMDAEFMEYLMSIPGREFMYHQFYHEWIKMFPDSFQSVQWQTYPTHLHCPIPTQIHAPNQWEQNALLRRQKGDLLCKRVSSLLTEGKTPNKLFNKWYLILSVVLHRLRLRDQAYVFKCVDMIASSYRNCI